jgi:hypothetical protein
MSGFYPSVMPRPVRLADGSVLAQDGTLIPFAASCPPDTAPDPATRTCTPWPGARNVNYECGGALVPLDAPGCGSARRMLPLYDLERRELEAVRPAWPGCNCSAPGAAVSAAAGSRQESGNGQATFDEKVACFVIALAIGAVILRLGE